MTEEEYKKWKEEKPARDKAREEQVAKRKKGLKGFAIGLSLFLAGLGTYGIIKHDIDHLSTSEISDELKIHSGHGSIEGYHQEPTDRHNCQVPYDGETYFMDRLAEKMEKEYSRAFIEDTADVFEDMCKGDYGEAAKRFEELCDSLEKRADGKYHEANERTKEY